MSVENLLCARLCCCHWHWGVTSRSKDLPLCMSESLSEEVNDIYNKGTYEGVIRTERELKGGWEESCAIRQDPPGR